MSLARMKRILRVDPVNRLAVVQPGVVNLRLSQAVAPEGLYFAPAPSSQCACTVGGNVGGNDGGAHCLKYGVTTNHVLALRVVLPDGEVVDLGGPPGTPGPDLVGPWTGSEGTLGIVTELTVRLLPLPEGRRTALAYLDMVAEAAGLEALRVCVEVGGSITGEHGVGIEKREAMCFLYDPPELEAMRAVRAAFDPKGLMNAGKMLPMPGRCCEVKAAAWDG